MAYKQPGVFGLVPKGIGVLSLAILLLSFSILGQNPTPTPEPSPEDQTGKPVTLRTDLVTLTLTVTDLYGRYVSGLTKKAFTIMPAVCPIPPK